MGMKGDFTFPPIKLENEVPSTPSFPPMLSSLENVVPSRTLRGVDSEKCVNDTFFGPDIDIRENRVAPTRPFACAGEYGGLEW